MSVVLATLCLNEMEHLPRLYAQHRNWPGLVKWVFVESADAQYVKANPTLVTGPGLSTDGTSEYLAGLAKQDPRIQYIPLGLSQHSDPAQGKCMSRQQYLLAADRVRPNFVFVLDADEYYAWEAQSRVMQLMQSGKTHTGFLFRQRHIWRPPSIREQPLLQFEVAGGFWDIPHVRGWRWYTGLQYRTNHNTPELPGGQKLDKRLLRFDKRSGTPECVHLGFASLGPMRAAKNRYYETRGEGVTDHRKWYTESRAAFETWQPGDELPHKARVISYTGPVPEVFQ